MSLQAFVFLSLATGAAITGFGGVAPASSGVAQVLFLVFVALFVGAVVRGWDGAGNS